MTVGNDVGPYGSLRDYLAMLDGRGWLVRIPEADQDAYEATGLMYRMIEHFGWTGAPALFFERIKIDGRWFEGPVIANLYGRWEYDALSFGLPIDGESQREAFRMALTKLADLAGADDRWQTIEPRTVSTDQAPCKEVVQKGEEINLLDLPFIQSNPADGGRYINTGSVVLEHPTYGRNIGTYRCQIKGPRKIAINPQPGQHGWTFLMDLKERGESFANAAVILGADPVVYAMSSSKAARLGQDELAVAGGFLGRPVEVVKCENSDILVPANVEIVIEGEIPFDMEPEGPFAEMYGYIGPQVPENFYMNVTAVTFRSKPMVVNHFSGVTRGFLTSPLEATLNLSLKREHPSLIALHLPLHMPGYCFASIAKQKPGDGLAIGRAVSAAVMLGKITVIVDQDVDIYDFDAVMRVAGARWQPHPATDIIEKARGSSTDPSIRKRGESSKIVIDATRQLPVEGGPAQYSSTNKQALVDGQPDVFERVDRKWAGLFKQLKRGAT